MSGPTPAKPAEKPLVIGFTLAEEVYKNNSLRKYAASGITHQRLVAEVPAVLPTSIIVCLTGLRGKYPLRLDLVDPSGEVVWNWSTPSDAPVQGDNPLGICEVTLLHLPMTVRRFGRHNLVLHANEEEIFRTVLEVLPKRIV